MASLDFNANENTGLRAKYDNYTTIDWAHDFSKDRIDHRKLQSLGGWRGHLQFLYVSSQSWIVLSLIGIAAGSLAAFIDISSEWLNDVKFGYCKEGWSVSENVSTSCGCGTARNCSRWVFWGTSAQIQSSAGRFALEYFLYVLFSIFFATTAAFLVQNYAPFAAGSGIPEVKTILSGFIIRKFLGLWTLIIKSVGLSLSVAAGLALGKEGPLVHVACCCGNIVSRWFSKFSRNEARKREILSAAASAGVSVAFGAPVGGVLFALEEASYYFPYKTLWRSFFCAMAAAVTLQLWNPFRTNQLVLFQVRFSRPWHAFELIWFVMLGVFGGLYGVVFIRLNLKVQRWRKTAFVSHWPIVEVASIAFITAVLGYINIFTRINMTQLVSHLFKECEEMDYHGLCDQNQQSIIIGSLLLVAVLKAALTCFTFGISVPAGIFIPSMAVGASFGRVIGMAVKSIQQRNPGSSIFWSCPAVGSCITPATYAMVGAAASLAGVTRMTVSLVVIVFELTGALTYVLPVMIAVMVAKWVADAIEPEGIYDALIRLRGYPFLDSRAIYEGKSILKDIMTPFNKLEVIYANSMTIGDLSQLLSKQSTDKVHGYPVILDKPSKLLVGYIGRSDLDFALSHAKANDAAIEDTQCHFIPKKVEYKAQTSPLLLEYDEDSQPPFVLTSDSNDMSLNFYPWMDQTPLMMSPHLPVEIVLELFRKLGLRYLMVCDRGRLEGILTKKDLLRHLDSFHSKN